MLGSFCPMPWKRAAQREESFSIFFSCVQIIEQKWNIFLLKSNFSTSLCFHWQFSEMTWATHCELVQGDFVSVCWRSEFQVQLFSDRTISPQKCPYLVLLTCLCSEKSLELLDLMSNMTYLHWTSCQNCRPHISK